MYDHDCDIAMYTYMHTIGRRSQLSGLFVGANINISWNSPRSMSVVWCVGNQALGYSKVGTYFCRMS